MMTFGMVKPIKFRPGPDGLHLYDRSTGTNVLINEVECPEDEWALAPRQVSIALTNSCNLHCPFCYAPKKPAEIDYNRLLGWLEELDTNGCLGVGLGGGEPLLFNKLPALCEYINEKTALAVTFTTNAHMLTPSFVNALRGRVAYIRVSMDGVGTTYEGIRGKSFSSLCRQLDLVKAISPFGINYVVNSQTVSELDEAIAFASEFGATEFLLLPEQPAQGRCGIDKATAREFQDWVNSYVGPIRLSVSEAGADGLPVCNPLEKETGLRSYAHIDASGRVKQSSFDLTGVNIGDDGVMQALLNLQQILENSRENLA
jgi:MoaA/NifB/PqqE/SkfB family radical SAM enzyme